MTAENSESEPIRLTGEALLIKHEKLKSEGVSAIDICNECGYWSYKADGGKRLNIMALTEALLEAKLEANNLVSNDSKNARELKENTDTEEINLPIGLNQYYFSGKEKAKNGDHKNAIDDFNKALEISPNNLYILTSLGVAKSNSGDKEGAVECYTKALEINPMDADFFNIRGFAKYWLGEDKSACKDWKKASELGNATELLHEYDKDLIKKALDG